MADLVAVTAMMIVHVFRLFTVITLDFAFDDHDGSLQSHRPLGTMPARDIVGRLSGSVYSEHQFNCNEKMFRTHSINPSRITFQSLRSIQRNLSEFSPHILSYKFYSSSFHDSYTNFSYTLSTILSHSYLTLSPQSLHALSLIMWLMNEIVDCLVVAVHGLQYEIMGFANRVQQETKASYLRNVHVYAIFLGINPTGKWLEMSHGKTCERYAENVNEN